MAAEAQTCAIGILTILNIIVSLHLSRVLYKSTLFMQNKANLPAAQMNVTSVITKHYENERLCRCEENKPKQTQFLKILDNLSIITSAPFLTELDCPLFCKYSAGQIIGEGCLDR